MLFLKHRDAKVRKKINSMDMKEVYTTVGKCFSVMWVFMVESLAEMMPWLVVMFSVIICDLITGCRRSFIMGEEVRFSRAFRATMGKMVTYFSFVLMVVFIEKAAGGEYSIDKWSILFICFIEFCSIISNILKPKGYDINVIGLLSVLGKKAFNIDKEDTKDVITKDDKKEN